MVWPFKSKSNPVQKRVVASLPAGKIIARFTPLKEFENKGSVYVPRLTYNVREGNKRLEQLAQDWSKEGKVKWL